MISKNLNPHENKWLFPKDAIDEAASAAISIRDLNFICYDFHKYLDIGSPR